MTMTGADEADYLSIIGLQSRTVMFPDGLERHITLSNWEWEVFDREHSATHPMEFIQLVASETAHMLWVRESFNNSASPQRRSADIERAQSEADPDRDMSHSRERFEHHLREQFRATIKQCMGNHVPGGKQPVNDKFRG